MYHLSVFKLNYTATNRHDSYTQPSYETLSLTCPLQHWKTWKPRIFCPHQLLLCRLPFFRWTWRFKGHSHQIWPPVIFLAISTGLFTKTSMLRNIYKNATNIANFSSGLQYDLQQRVFLESSSIIVGRCTSSTACQNLCRPCTVNMSGRAQTGRSGELIALPQTTWLDFRERGRVKKWVTNWAERVGIKEEKIWDK